ncbi:type III-A CRISPR-associated protein Cas10/Csm1 [Thermus amyloliquefaciens]|uniref:type III-A CRISPR-associated protein Cas10/Csm1 n=1 Tax=Thermus amyloliquefaciens TaxID=1449080 RepID=UPI00056F506B|nr:type III-A CRISPR-associated protein Cas10/Csm1 [Thermus amyloliquefaciens]
MADGTHLALACLLHDIGKLLQRASWGGEALKGKGSPRHPSYSAEFVELYRHVFQQAGVDPGWLKTTVKRHHEGWKLEEFQPQTPEEWCVALADTFASKEREEATQGQPGGVTETPLLSIFHPLRLQGQEGERLGLSPVHGRGEGLKPGAPYPESCPNIRKEVYHRLFERVKEGMEDLARRPPKDPQVLLLSLAALFQESLALVPADTQSEPDVSLYDHLRLTAAIAHALWAYHGGKASVADLRQDGEKFLLVVGDFGGIQGHIYRIAGAETGVGGIAKRLRARSLEVSLAAEAMALGLLRRIGLTPLNRLMGAGGKFYLLLPNTEEARRALEEAQRAWGEWALRGGASLLPHLALLPFRGQDFRDFAALLRRAHRELALAKLRPFPHLQRTEDTLRQALRPCAACGLRPARKDEPGSLCPECEREAAIGRLLPQRDRVGFFVEEAFPPFFGFPGLKAALGKGPLPQAWHTYRAQPDFTPDGTSFEVKPLLGHLPTVAHALRAKDMDLEKYRTWALEEGLWEEEEGLEEDRPLTFGELAALSEGVPYLGGLMLDADRMGEAFATGFRREDRDLATPSRIAALSRALEWFFSVEVLELIRNPTTYAKRLGWNDLEAKVKARRYPLLYSVYSGGDDLFLLGPWDALLEFALDLERLYRLYTRHPALTLSGAFLLFGPKTPVPQMAEALREGEKRAKDAGRGRLYLFGRAVAWEELRALKPWQEDLRRHLREEAVSKAQAYRWLTLWKQFWAKDLDEGERMRYKPLLAYALRRVREKDQGAWKRYLELLDHTQPAWTHLPVWVQWALYGERRG